MSDTHASAPAAITGIGVVLPTGNSVDSLWQHWTTQKSALRPYRSDWIATDRIRYFGSVGAEDHAQARECVPHKLRRFGTPTTYLGVMAAGRALRQADIETKAGEAEHWGLYTAQGDYTSSSFLGFQRALEAQPRGAGADGKFALDLRRLTEDALYARGLDPFSAIKGLANNLLALVSLTHRFRGEGGAFVQNESAVYAALDAALFALRHGHCELALVVAAGSYDEVWTLAEQAQSGRLSPCTRQERSLRSFDRARDGTVLAEGAVALVLETPAQARKRGAKAAAWISGLGCTAAALGQGVPDHAYTRASERALRQAHVKGAPGGGGIDAVLVDGKGTLGHDRDEIRLLNHLRHALGDATKAAKPALPLTTVRPITGMVAAAGGLMDVALAARMLQTGRIPPVPGLEDPENAELGWVRDACLERPLQRVLTLQHGFGGFCSAIVVDHAACHA